MSWWKSRWIDPLKIHFQLLYFCFLPSTIYFDISNWAFETRSIQLRHHSPINFNSNNHAVTICTQKCLFARFSWLKFSKQVEAYLSAREHLVGENSIKHIFLTAHTRCKFKGGKCFNVLLLGNKILHFYNEICNA